MDEITASNSVEIGEESLDDEYLRDDNINLFWDRNTLIEKKILKGKLPEKVRPIVQKSLFD